MLAFAVLAGCARHRPQPLGEVPLSASLPPLASALQRRIDPAAPLDMTEMSLVALVNNSNPALAQSDTAYRAGNLDLLDWTGARGALLARQPEGVALEQALHEQAIAITAMLGFILPAASTEGTAP